MTNAELKELIHLLMMCGIMDKTALESGNVTNEDWLRMERLIDKYQADKTEPEVQGDLISRAALLKAMEEERQYLLARGQRGAEHILVHHCLPLIDNAPTVEPCYQTTSCLDCDNYDKENHNCPRYCEVIKEAIKSRPQGEWVKVVNKISELETETHWECSECHNPDFRWGEAEFCSFCGASMTGGKEE